MRPWPHFALASHIEAVLKVIPDIAKLNAAVRAERGLVYVAFMHWNLRDHGLIRNVVCGILGVPRLELVELCSGTASLPKTLQISKQPALALGRSGRRLVAC